ncbi:MAG: hypothetical protein JNL67_17685 [Planctomycetaceae bacterium]|nr:hypothetical protein [Planctomycetaceae bacterium]
MLNQNRWLLNSWALAAAFSTYFFMYMFRKPFTAAAFENEGGEGWDSKAVLVAAQVIGYFCSKLIGIRVISQMTANKRAIVLLSLIAIAQVALLIFAVLPRPWHVAAIFLNGLPLGMVFGLVLGFLEGRRLTEALVAGLCASFILAGGVAKSIGQWTLNYLVAEMGCTLQQAEQWMPFGAGCLFVVPIAISTWMLSQIPPPDEQDTKSRSERVAMTGEDRRLMLQQYGLGLAAVAVFYLLVTILRSLRDDFAPQILSGMGATVKAVDYSWIDTQVAAFVLLVNGMTSWISGNRAALLFSLIVSLSGFGLIAGALLSSHQITPLWFMVLIGAGLYLPYVAVHTTVFERLIALTRNRGNMGYLMYVVDSLGYLAYVVILLLPKSALLGEQTADNAFYHDFREYCWIGLSLSSVACIVAIGYFARLRSNSN